MEWLKKYWQKIVISIMGVVAVAGLFLPFTDQFLGYTYSYWLFSNNEIKTAISDATVKLVDDQPLVFGTDNSATSTWDSANEQLLTEVGRSSITRTDNTETHTVTNFIFKPIGNGITWSNFAYIAAANLNFLRANGSDGAEESVGNGNILHSSFIKGYHQNFNGGDYITGGEWRFTADGTISAAGAAELPTRVELYLTPDNSTSRELAFAVGNDKLAEFYGDVEGKTRFVRSKSVYTGTDTLDDVYLHVVDSAGPFTLTVPDSTQDGEEIKIMNRGTAPVTLSGKLSSVTAVTTLYSGERIILNWDAADDEWQ